MLVYRNPHATMPPPWLADWQPGPETPDNVSVQQRGSVFWLGSAFAGIDDIEDDDWQELDADWQVALIGKAADFAPVSLTRQGWPGPVELVTDALGRTWLCPVMLGPGGQPAVPQVWSDTADGVPVRQPRKEHQALVTIGGEIAKALATPNEEHDCDFWALPVELARDWAATGLAAVNHIPKTLITRGCCELVDETLVVHSLFVLAGFGTPEARITPEGEFSRLVDDEAMEGAI